jgi:hypothetical protein
MLEIKLTKGARRGWRWEVRDDDTGKLMAHGRERDRPSARYQAERALFLLLNVMSRRHLRSKDNNRSADDHEAL